jgi:Na+-driven multidrug efflux pump
MALHYSLTGALIGAADTRWPLYGSFVGMYLIRLPLAVVGSYILGVSIMWIWLIILADHYSKALVLSVRFLSRKWMKITV